MSSRTGLMSATELASRLDEVGRGLAVIDLRQDPTDQVPAIPGSAWVDLHDGFAQRRPERGLTYDLPRPDEVAASLSRLGIGPATEVVFADDMLNRWSTRAYWVLRYYRHPAPAWVLDGGLAAWRAAGAPVSEAVATPAPSDYPPPASTDESIRISADELRAGLAAGTALACDVRTPDEYTGADARAARGGHVPGAAFVPFERCLAPDHTFLPEVSLADALEPFLAPGVEPIPYCQGGIRASLTWFCLHELLGRPARLYAASWEEWGNRPDLPVEAA